MTFGDFTAQELLMLAIIIAAIVLIIGALFKTLLKVAVVAACFILIFGVGFGWLPQKLEELNRNQTTIGDIYNEITTPTNNVLNQAQNVYNEISNKINDPQLQEDLWNTLTSLFNKLVELFNPSPVANTANNTVENNVNP